MKKKISVILAVVMILALCGCGSSSKASSDRYMGAAGVAAPMAPAEAPEMYWNDAGEYYYESDSAATAEEAGGSVSVFPEGTKMVYTADIEMQSTEFDAAVESLKALVNANRGYFENSSVSTRGSYRYGYYSVRVPAENYRAFVEAVGENCLRTYFSESAEDISEVYYDTQSRLETQKTKLDRLQNLLAQAENMEDIITIESAISETELYIERLGGTMRHYDSMVGYSTVGISLSEVYKLANVEEPAIGFGAKLGTAFRSGCTNFVSNIEDLIISIAYGWIGFLIFIAVVVVVVVLILRYRRRKKQLMAQRVAAYQQQMQAKAEEEKKAEENT